MMEGEREESKMAEREMKGGKQKPTLKDRRRQGAVTPLTELEKIRGSTPRN